MDIKSQDNFGKFEYSLWEDNHEGKWLKTVIDNEQFKELEILILEIDTTDASENLQMFGASARKDEFMLLF